MLSLAKRFQYLQRCFRPTAHQFRSVGSDTGSPSPARRRNKFQTAMMKKIDDKSEWWVVDGEMHEIGENVPLRERFVIPRENIPNKRRKQLREQFMRRTRLVIKESVSIYYFFLSQGFQWLNSYCLVDETRKKMVNRPYFNGCYVYCNSYFLLDHIPIRSTVYFWGDINIL